MAQDQLPHPAKYSQVIYNYLEDLVDDLAPRFDRRPIRILDPMAGVGLIHGLARPVLVSTTGLEIEPEWAEQHSDTIEGDATDMPFGDSCFELVIFSPPYGNRMADQFVSKDGTHRVTYYHFLDRRLHENSAAGKHFGPGYTKIMREILVECKRVVVPDGLIVINVSNFIRAGQEVDVVGWYVDTMVSLGYRVLLKQAIPTKRMKFGANYKLRVECEYVITFQRRRF